MRLLDSLLGFLLVPTSLQNLMTVSGSRYTLVVPFSVPYPALWTEDLTVKVILPEHATNVHFDLPLEVQEVRTCILPSVGYQRLLMS